MRTVGEGNLKKVLWLVGAFVIGIFVMTWLVPFAASYEVKTAAKMLCGDMIKLDRAIQSAKASGDRPYIEDKQIRTSFLNRTRQAKVTFQPNDFDPDCASYSKKDEPHCFSYHYAFDKQADQHVCTIHVRYQSDTEPALIGQVLQEVPHLKIHHHLEIEQRVRRDF